MSIKKPFGIIYRNRNVLMSTAMVDIKAKFAGSLLGVFWLLLYPLLLLTAYSVVYIFIFKARFGEMNSVTYVLLIFAGLIPFLGFTESIASTIVSVTSNSSLIKNTLFPIDIIPVKAVICSQTTQAVSLVFLIIANLIAGNGSWYMLFIGVIWFFQILFSIGLGWILSCLNVYLKDLQNVVNLINLFLMMVSPIAYTIDMVPEGLRPLLAWNPLYYFIAAYQDTIIQGRFPQNNVMWVLMIFSIIFFIFGYWFFCKMKEVFTDNI